MSNETIEKLETLNERIGELQAKRIICENIIDKFRREPDPRAPDLISSLMGQQRKINEMLVGLIKERREILGVENPDNITVGMKPAKINARRLSA